MPNWLQGNFRARGPKENIIRFISEGLEPSSLLGQDDEIDMELKEYDEDYITVRWTRNRGNEKDYPEWIYISGTERHFLQPNDFGEFDIHQTDSKTDFIMVVSFKADWGIKIDQMREIAKKYEIDIRINGYELGMEFEQIIEVTRKGCVLTEGIDFISRLSVGVSYAVVRRLSHE